MTLRRRFRGFKRLHRRKTVRLGSIVLLLFGLTVGYAGYMDQQQLSVNPRTYRSLLEVISKAESNGNYNAYYGNPSNTSIDFTTMTIADVLRWQQEHVANGSPSSAVGRYQFLNTTLKNLVHELRIDTNTTFDAANQDALAIALIERRGAVAYVNNELTAEQFAANLAKEWAGLPNVTGDKPDQSYYAGDGLNAARVMPDEVLNAIKPIAAD